MDEKQLNSVVYSRQVVEFVAVGSEFCRIVENAGEYSAPALADLTRKILPLLYFKASLLPDTAQQLDEPLEKYVNELDYNMLLFKWASILGESDSYYEVFDPDIQFGSETVTAGISENIMDIYQDLKDFITSYSLGNEEVMNDALFVCRSHFGEFWGQRLVNVLRALHQLVFSGIKDESPIRHKETNHDDKPQSTGWVDHFFRPSGE